MKIGSVLFFTMRKKRTDPIFTERNKNARNIIQQVDRDEMIEELVKSYMEKD